MVPIKPLCNRGFFHLMSRHRWSCLVLPSIIHFLGYSRRLMK
ncbi:Uncharacterised protein [Vibrio cholerae]|nr:Uncharacterised protein [Vibrio cholerae]